jgi:tetratricopeptide (TPR) repeat protein
MNRWFDPDRFLRWAVPAAFLLIFGVYLFCMPSGVTFEDSGEFALAARTLGVAHPPGYPVFLLGAHLFSLLPFGSDPATGTNLFSLMCALAGLFLFFKILKSVTNDLWLSLASVFLLAFSRTFWNTSLITEVYLLNFLFWSALAWMTLRYVRPDGLFIEGNSGLRADRLPIAGAFIMGVALGNHQMIAFSLPAMFVLLAEKKTSVPFRTWMLAGLFGLLGLVMYAYLPIRALADPYLNWGDPSTWTGFRNVFTREQYGDIGWSGWDWKVLFRQLLFLNPLFEYFGFQDFQDIHRHVNFSLLVPYLMAFIVAIAGWLADPSRRTRRFFLLMAFFFGPFLVFFTRTPATKEFTLKVFFLPFWAVFGYYFLRGLLRIAAPFAKGKERVFLLLPLIPFILNLRENNFRNYPYTADYVRNMFNSLPLDAVLFTVKDNETFPTWEYQGARRIRPDASVVNYVSLSEPWYRNHLRQIYPVLMEHRPEPVSHDRDPARIEFFHSFFDAPIPQGGLFCANREIELPSGWVFRPWGALYRLVQTNGPAVPGPVFFPAEHALSYRGLDRSVRQKYYDVMTLLVVQTYSVLAADTAHAFREAGDADRALRYYERSSRFNRLLDFEINNFYNYYFTGLIHMAAGRKEEGVRWWKRAVELQPQSQAAGEIRSALQSMEQPSTVTSAALTEAEKLYSAGRFSEAVPYYQDALKKGELVPERAYANIGDCYFNAGKYAEATRWYRQSIAANPDYITPYYNLGGTLLMTGRKEDAIMIWKDGLRRDPSNSLIQGALRQYGGGR